MTTSNGSGRLRRCGCGTSLDGKHWNTKYCDTCKSRLTSRPNCLECGEPMSRTSILSTRPKRYCKGDKCQRARKRKADLAAKYNMTLEQYDDMLMGQGGVCAVCKQPETALPGGRGPSNQFFPRALGVDHNHATGKVRGLLCNRCNSYSVRAVDELFQKHIYSLPALRYVLENDYQLTLTPLNSTSNLGEPL